MTAHPSRALTIIQPTKPRDVAKMKRPGEREIDQLIARTVEDDAGLSSDRRDGANPTLDMTRSIYYNPVTVTVL